MDQTQQELTQLKAKVGELSTRVLMLERQVAALKGMQPSVGLPYPRPTITHAAAPQTIQPRPIDPMSPH